MAFYTSIASNPLLSSIEENILYYWNSNNTFHKSLERHSSDQYVFYDGPPFANGLPHYGHLLSGYIKDVFARYKTMQKYYVARRFGWDCHGLPAELASEKELKISGRVAIQQFGVDKFNEYCKTSVLKYTKEWHWYVDRQARWVNFENAYKTMDLSYMESVLWVFKTLYDKNLIYKSNRVMPYSWACETPVSDFETKIDNSYREKQSKTATIAVKLIQTNHLLVKGDLYILIWTTTPWTLPSNLAIAVSQNIRYAIIESNNKYYIIAENLAKNFEKEIGNVLVQYISGKDLIGLKYIPMFKYFENHTNAFQIIHGDFVTTEDGTGAVHIAPGFGEDDQKICAEYNIEIVCPVDSKGCFTDKVTDYVGMQVFDANDKIILHLKSQGMLIKSDIYTHNYPFCWRTDTPLIYKAVPSWYLRVTQIRSQMIENNKQINWIPNHIQSGLFGKWLENARDWSISRNRFWGCPIPIWESTDSNYPHIEVYGSIAEIEQSFNVKIEDLHLPFIDTLTKPNPSDPTGQSILRRVPEVLDCWFESGAMPYAQAHYPFENKEWFHNNFPANFIVEYVAQTRGWFYTLLVLSTALFNKPPFLNCICHGVILGNGGQKMSKRLQNYPNPKDVFDKYGSDALRCFMLSSSVVRGQDLVINTDCDGIQESIKRIIKPLWNAYNFFILYANIDNYEATLNFNSLNFLDRYILSSLAILVKAVENCMNHYDLMTAFEEIEKFLDNLNNWYIRRSRDRFWQHNLNLDKCDAFNTLYSVIVLLCRAIAPLLPFITEEIHLNLCKSSVHLELFANIDEILCDQALVNNMNKVKQACNAALHIRNQTGIRVRQPLKSVTFVGLNIELTTEMQQLVLSEVNVKEWINLDKNLIEKYADFKLQLNLPKIGKRIPENVKHIIIQTKANNWQLINDVLYVDKTIILYSDEYTLKLEPKHTNNCAALDSNDGLVILNLEIDEDLQLEGIARDIIRFIQQTRKNLALNITNRIDSTIITSDLLVHKAVKIWYDFIINQTLSIKIQCIENCEEYNEQFVLDHDISQFVKILIKTNT